MTVFDRVADALDSATGYRPARAGADFRCPAHEDKTASLSVTDEDGKVLIHCHAGCDVDAVLDAVKLTRRDLFESKPSESANGRGRGKIVATYDYVDETGALLYQVVRKEPKAFLQRRPNPYPNKPGNFIWNLQNTRRVLYRLPAVRTAVKAGTTIYVVEGEKDCLALETAGEVATCNSGGAGEWRPGHTAGLAGAAEVIIVADKDAPGRAHAAQVARALAPVVENVIVMEVATGFKDVAEHLGAGRTVDELEQIDLEPSPLGPLLDGREAEPVGNDEDEVTAWLKAPDGYYLNDEGNASRLVVLGKQKIRYVLAWGKWIVYKNGRWHIDHADALVTELAKGVGKALRTQVADFQGGEKATSAFVRYAIAAGGAARVSSMIRMARGDPAMIVEHEDLDNHPLLLNVLNGEVDLTTGLLLPPDPNHLHTMQAPVVYDPDATCPLFLRCLATWHPDEEMRDYLQTEAGSGAIGHPYETLSIHHGEGNNGKGKFWGAIQAVLGPYCVTVDKSLLIAEKHAQHPTEKARLFRARLGMADETAGGDSLDEEQVKAITGGDKIKGRRMYEDPWEFDPTHTLVLKTNEMPKIKGRNEAIWRRVRHIPWTVIIPPNDRDEGLAEKLAAESSGILNWVVAGAMRCHAEGFKASEVVKLATDTYRGDQDTLGMFMSECLVFAGGGFVTSSWLTLVAEAWCQSLGLEPLDMKVLAPDLKRRGCRPSRRTINRRQESIWSGVSFSAGYAPED